MNAMQPRSGVQRLAAVLDYLQSVAINPCDKRWSGACPARVRRVDSRAGTA
jgi:hypothetical protein